MEFKIGDKVRALKGSCLGKEGEVNAIADDARYSIGVHITGEKVFTIWFEPDALEKIDL